jgi:hypothetical protein
MSAILFTSPCGPGHNMKFRFCNLFVRLGSAPTEENNFISIEQHGANCLVRVAAFAEQFDASLAFYMEVSAGMRGGSDSCWFELQRRARKRLPAEIIKGIGMVGYTGQGVLYGNIGSYEIMTLMNEFWLSDRFRIIGTSRVSATAAVELATALDKGLHDSKGKLPPNVIFVLEKQYYTHEPFLVMLVDNGALNSTRALISSAAVRLQRPLLEVGPGAWGRWPTL